MIGGCESSLTHGSVREVIGEQLLGEEAEVDASRSMLPASMDLKEIMSEVSHVSAARAPSGQSFVLRWFKAYDMWSGRWDSWGPARQYQFGHPLPASMRGRCKTFPVSLPPQH